MQKQRTSNSLLRPALAAALALAPATVCADGNETLGPPVGLTVASGTDVLAAGTGLFTQPGTIELQIPAGAAIQQVLLYWEERGTSTDDTIVVNGTEVKGSVIGQGAAPPGTSTSFRADITGLGLVANGPNVLTVEGLNPPIDDEHRNDGASVVVIIDDGSGAASIELRDGNDFAFWRLPPPEDTTVPQTFTFAAAAVDRTADLFLLIGDGTQERPDEIEVTIGDQVSLLVNEARGRDGAEWDTIPLSLGIPAGVTSLTVRLFSRDTQGAGGSPDSLSWVAAALAVPPVPCRGVIGDFVWLDLDGDSIQDAGEPGIAGVKVELHSEGGQLISSATTDSNGLYRFAGLCAGKYSVRVDGSTVPDDLDPCPCEMGSDRAVDSNCQPAAVTLETEESQDLTIDFCYVRTPDEGGEGCTPGYWKQKHHFDSWPEPYKPTDRFSDVFGSQAFGGKTLLQVLKQGGGKINALGRHAVAALLNAASSGVSYDMQPEDVISGFNAAASQGNKAIEKYKNQLEAFNTQGCPLN